MRAPFRFTFSVSLVSLVIFTACTGAPNPGADAARDVSGDSSNVEAAAVCTTDLQCSNDVFCDGTERCMPGAAGADTRGCVHGTNPCEATQRCDEASTRCITQCSVSEDADGDGHRARTCGGDDCDDSDGNRFPGNAEVCDSAGHDEDCDSTTVGARDGDTDGYIDAMCCNRAPGAIAICGNDCDDARGDVHPHQPELCNGIDDNCDGSSDEGLAFRDYFPDCDGDGFGDSSASPLSACAAPATHPTCASGSTTAQYVANATDCDDTDSQQHPGAPESCNGADDNCNGSVDESISFRDYFPDCDGDGFGDASATATTTCAPPSAAPSCTSGSTSAQYVGNATDCDDTRAQVHPGSPELCNGVDDNCNGSVDDAIVFRDYYPDCDGDGSGDASATAQTGCAPPSAAPTCAMPAAGAGYATLANDCDDTDPRRHPGLAEVCNGIDDDCNGRLDGPGEDQDNDGFVNAACVTSNGDCDDLDPSVHPGATESCDGIDSDCSNPGHAHPYGSAPVNALAVDEDADHDGHAPRSATCISGPAPLLPLDDCDDRAPLRFPGSTEYCNGVDDDCDGIEDNLPGGALGSACSFRRLFVGANHNCLLTRETRALCWGSNTYGQLGDGTTTDRLSPVPVPGLDAIREMDLGTAHSCAVLVNGHVMCWGRDDSGQLGDRGSSTPRTSPVEVPGIVDAAGVACGPDFTCVLRANGTVMCFGGNASGQLGDGTTSARFTPTMVVGLLDATRIDAGTSHVCAVRSGGGVVCWGLNDHGQLGDRTNTTRSFAAPVQMLGTMRDVSLGSSHSCALRSDGYVLCWGSNVSGQLGNGTTTDSNLPTPAMLTATAIAAGADHTCGTRSDTTLWCWGSNTSGQLGIGAMGNQLRPSAVRTGILPLTGFGDVGAGASHTCSQLTNGLVQCWGANASGQLGTNTTTSSNVPVTVAGLNVAQQVATAARSACALRRDGTVSCWGENVFGQNGNGTTGGVQSTPGTVMSLANAVQIDGSPERGGSFCARLGDGTVWCWGENGAGQLGDGTTTARSLPVQVAGITDAMEITTGFGFTCAVRRSGAVSCWGAGSSGQLGNGASPSRSLVPVMVQGLTDAVHVSAGSTHACARRIGGAVVCWGSNANGQLGVTSPASSNMPVLVTAFDDALEVQAGAQHTCARRVDSSLWCWGSNSSGQLGDGTTTSRSAPATVPALPSSVYFDLGTRFTCGITATGVALCFGDNGSGQLGLGPAGPFQTSSPLPMRGVSDWVEMRGGFDFSCGRRVTGQVLCSGSNAYGQLGNGTMTSSTTPVPVIGP